MLLLLVACAGDGPAPPGAGRPRMDDTGSDTAADTRADTAAAEPSLTILAPADGATWFLGVRYDVVAKVADADTAAATITGASGTCSPLADGILHCTVIADAPAAIDVAITASGPGGSTSGTVSVSAREAVGIVPGGEAFAMGMYQVMDEAWFAPVAAGKFNLAQSYGTGGYSQEEWQDWSAAAGMRTMTRPGWNWADPWELSSPATLQALAARPELAWWEVPETPVEDDSYADEVRSVVSVIREYDDRPTQMYFWTSSTAEQIASYVPDIDVISPGTYPEHACQPQPWIRWRIQSALHAVAIAGYAPEERPVVGTADLYGQPETTCPGRVAELAQVRMNPLAMIAAGAHGVIYFAWDYAENSLDPAWGESAKATGDLVMGESGLGYAVVHGQAIGDLDVTVISGPTESEAFTPAQSTTEVQYPSIHAAGWDYAGARFVVAVNYTDEPVRAQVAGFPTVTTDVEVVGEDRSATVTAGVVEEAFDAWGAHVYRAPIVLE